MRNTIRRYQRPCNTRKTSLHREIVVRQSLFLSLSPSPSVEKERAGTLVNSENITRVSRARRPASLSVGIHVANSRTSCTMCFSFQLWRTYGLRYTRIVRSVYLKLRFSFRLSRISEKRILMFLSDSRDRASKRILQRAIPTNPVWSVIGFVRASGFRTKRFESLGTCSFVIHESFVRIIDNYETPRRAFISRRIPR